MSKLEEFQNYLPPIYDDVKEIQEILKTESTEYEELDSNILSVSNDIFIDSTEDSGLKRYEKIFNITVPEGATFEERRSVIKSILRGIDKLNGTVIKNISLAYQNGEVDINFDSIANKINIKFISVMGIPTNLAKLQEYLNERKPAHLDIFFEFKYNTYSIINNYTYSELSAYTYEQIRSSILP